MMQLVLLCIVSLCSGLDVTALKSTLRLAAARANRGFTASTSARGAVARIASELEGADTSQTPTASSMLLGEWYLDWTDAADVLSLQLSLMNIGDIRQDISRNSDDSITASNSVMLSPPGSSLLPFADWMEAKYTVVAACQALSTYRLSLLFIGASLQLPSTPFPEVSGRLPQLAISALQDLVGERVFLDTTYLDEDLRIARGPGQELYILSKR